MTDSKKARRAAIYEKLGAGDSRKNPGHAVYYYMDDDVYLEFAVEEEELWGDAEVSRIIDQVEAELENRRSMTHLTVAQAAERWGLKARIVRKHCADGRIAGADKVGRDWMIPTDAPRPDDTRRQEFTLYTWIKYIYSTDDVPSIFKRLSRSSLAEIKQEVAGIYDQFLEPEVEQAHSIDKTATYLWKRARFWAYNYPGACEKWFAEN